MGTNSAGNAGSPNNGKTDEGRGSSINFPFTKGGRKTGKVGSSGTPTPNSNTVDGNKRVVNDPRLS